MRLCRRRQFDNFVVVSPAETWLVVTKGTGLRSVFASSGGVAHQDELAGSIAISYGRNGKNTPKSLDKLDRIERISSTNVKNAKYSDR